MISRLTNKIYPLFLSKERKDQFERIIFIAAIVFFVLHFLLIVLANSGILPLNMCGMGISSSNPITAIYTPFTIILLYEIYSLIYYLPKSITIYLGKQYEIIALILIRRIFNDLAQLSSANVSMDPEGIKVLLLSFVGLILLLLLIFCFYKLSGNKEVRLHELHCKTEKERRFVLIKKLMALGLMAVFIFLFVRSFFDLKGIPLSVNGIVDALRIMNKAFFNHFFTALILTEVLLLLFTFNLAHKFNKVIRNSGFIISTILLKLSFRAEGLANVAIILVAVAFGVAILGVHRLFEQKLAN